MTSEQKPAGTDDTTTSDEHARGLAELARSAAVECFFHARDLETGAELGYHDEIPVVTASVFKLPVLVELFRQADGGLVDLSEQVEVAATDRAAGPTGISRMRYPLRIAWRDLAVLMMTVSDNAATDVVCERVGIHAVNATLEYLGLSVTRLVSDCRGIYAQIAEAGVDPLDATGQPLAADVLRRIRAIDPTHTNRTTPREMTRLLELIWNDEAASADACAEMRDILSHQVWPHRLASGFPEDEVSTSGKTGTILGWKNEVGVVDYQRSGGRYAIACFTLSRERLWKNPDADALIGAAARLAVQELRMRSPGKEASPAGVAGLASEG